MTKKVAGLCATKLSASIYGPIAKHWGYFATSLSSVSNIVRISIDHNLTCFFPIDQNRSHSVLDICMTNRESHGSSRSYPLDSEQSEKKGPTLFLEVRLNHNTRTRSTVNIEAEYYLQRLLYSADADCI